MKISDIKAQRRKGRYSIFVDGSYSFSLSELQFIDAGLRVGDELTQDQIDQYAADSNFGKALDRVYNFLSYRSRSKREVITYMTRHQYDEEHVNEIIRRLEEQKFLDDAQFALDWVESRQQLSPRSKQQLRAELHQKGIAGEFVEQALANVDSDDEAATVVAVIEQKKLRTRYDDERKLIRYLAGRGFSIAAIKAALERLETSL